MTNQRFTYRKGSNSLTVDVYLKATDTFLGSLTRGRGASYYMVAADGKDMGQTWTSRDTAAGNLYGRACEVERERLTPERNLDGDLADRPTECCAEELAGNAAGITCGCDACEAPAEREPVTIAQALGEGVRVTDNHGHSYQARILVPGSPYGNSGTWGGVFYQEGRVGVTIDGTPATYNADAIAGLSDRPYPGPLAIDSGQGWLLTQESTDVFVQLAKQAMGLAGLS